jgi:hypothetical protein
MERVAIHPRDEENAWLTDLPGRLLRKRRRRQKGVMGSEVVPGNAPEAQIS